MHDSIRNQLDQHGYVVLTNFLTPEECDELVEAGNEMAMNLPPKEERYIFTSVNAEKQQLKDEYFIKSNDKISYFFEETALNETGDLKVDPTMSLNKIGHALHYLHPIFRCYTYSERVKSVCRIFGVKEPAVVQSMYIFKNPGVGSEAQNDGNELRSDNSQTGAPLSPCSPYISQNLCTVPEDDTITKRLQQLHFFSIDTYGLSVIPHQDITYLHTEPVPPLGFWIALEDANVENSCLWFIRGSHKSGVHRRLIRNPNKNEPYSMVYNQPNAYYPESSFVPVAAAKGTCILIHGNVVHRSAKNKSNMSRHAYTFHVIEKKNNNYSPENWLQEGQNAPFENVYTTNQNID